jgi:hypothetical protein
MLITYGKKIEHFRSYPAYVFNLLFDLSALLAHVGRQLIRGPYFQAIIPRRDSTAPERPILGRHSLVEMI